MIAFQTHVNHHGAFVGAQVLQHLEDGLQLLLGDVGVDDILVAGVAIVIQNAVYAFRAFDFAGHRAAPAIYQIGIDFMRLGQVNGLGNVRPLHYGYAEVAREYMSFDFALCTQNIGIYQAGFKELADHGQRVLYAGLQQGTGYFVIAHDHIIAQAGIISIGNRVQRLQSIAGEADGVLLTVLIQIGRSDCRAEFKQAFYRGGSLQI